MPTMPTSTKGVQPFLPLGRSSRRLRWSVSPSTPSTHLIHHIHPCTTISSGGMAASLFPNVGLLAVGGALSAQVRTGPQQPAMETAQRMINIGKTLSAPHASFSCQLSKSKTTTSLLLLPSSQAAAWGDWVSALSYAPVNQSKKRPSPLLPCAALCPTQSLLYWWAQNAFEVSTFHLSMIPFVFVFVFQLCLALWASLVGCWGSLVCTLRYCVLLPVNCVQF